MLAQLPLIGCIALFVQAAPTPDGSEVAELNPWEQAAGWTTSELRSLPSRVLGAFELEFRHRAPDAQVWSRTRLVVRADQSAWIMSAGRIVERDASQAGPFEVDGIRVTPAQTAPGWRLSAIEGPGTERLRDLRLRERPQRPDDGVDLFAQDRERTWRELGDARYSWSDGELLAEVGGGAQSFLFTRAEWSDFALELEFRNEAPGNSGVQIRSHATPEGRLRGYQIEIDPSPRAWTGGLYDEFRRGWLDDLADDPLARAAFRAGAWNRLRVECIGPSIRSWLNDVPCADDLDVLDLRGGIGLQVHSGRDTKLRFRGLRVVDLGASTWAAMEAREFAAPGGAGKIGDSFELPACGGAIRANYSVAATGSEPAFSKLEVLGPGWRIESDLAANVADGSPVEWTVIALPRRVVVLRDDRRITLSQPLEVTPSSDTRGRAIEVRLAHSGQATLLAARQLVRAP